MTDESNIERGDCTLEPRDENVCPAPSAHDKLSEAHYFIHEMILKYHFPDEFRYSLSAFFQAARSATLMIQSELAHCPGFDVWWTPYQDRMRNDPELKLLNDFRVTTFHKSSLIPASKIFAGHFKYGRPKSGLLLPISPMTPTFGAFLSARRLLADQEHPHRLWEGEECGIQRTWQLKEIPNRELVDFCIQCWEKIAQVVVDAHVWRGAKFQPEAGCKRSLADYRTIRESEVFVEVQKAWDSEPTETVRCQGNELKFFAEPRNDSEVLLAISTEQQATGWVGGDSPMWDRNFVSMLVYSLNGETITNNTCVFFRHVDAVITSIELA